MTRPREPFADRLYRALLRLFPSAFRGDFGPEMEAVFRDEREEARRQGLAGLVRLWGRTVAGVFRVAPREHWDILRRDTGYALRTLRRNPVFATVAVLTLSIGIGANAAVFSVIDALLLRPLPVPDAGRVVRVYGQYKDHRFDVVSYPNFADLRDRSAAFLQLTVHRNVDVSLGAGEDSQPEPLGGELVGGNYFTTLNAPSAAGRPILPDDDRVEGARAVAVISHRLWVRRFGAAPGTVGRTIRLNGAPFEVVGVMPPSFLGSFPAMPVDVWVPLSMHDALRHTGLSRERRGWGWLWMTGRLKPGVSIAQAAARLDTITQRLDAEHPRMNDGFGVGLYRASALPEETRESATRLLGFSMAVVILALLVACANIAGVMQARLAARRLELAIRQSLGASRLRLARQWLTESLVLAAIGGAAGLALARWTFGALEAALPPAGPFGGVVPALALDARVVAFSVALVALTAVLFGLLPAWRAGRLDLAPAIGEGSARLAGGRRQTRARRALVVLQVAACLVLLVVSGLLVRSVRRAAAFDVGFDTRHLALVSIDLKRFGYPPDRVRRFYDDLASRVRALPGVEAVTTGFVVPLGDDRERITFRVDGATPPGDPDGFHFDYNLVGAGYFRTLGIPIVEGRGFDARDEAPGAAPVAVVNETLARRLWPGGDALGHTLQPTGGPPSARIVGVARDIKYYTLGEEPRPYVYAPAAPFGAGALTVHVRTAGDPAPLLPALRAAAVALDGNVTPAATTYDAFRSGPLFPSRAMAAVAGAFGLLVLVLAAVGLYGTLAAGVAERTHEIGVRLAFGASPGRVFTAVVGQAAGLAVAGLALGFAGARAASGALASQLLGVAPADPLTYALVGAFLLAVTILAAWVPARRAARVDPVVALRE